MPDADSNEPVPEPHGDGRNESLGPTEEPQYGRASRRPSAPQRKKPASTPIDTRRNTLAILALVGVIGLVVVVNLLSEGDAGDEARRPPVRRSSANHLVFPDGTRVDAIEAEVFCEAEVRDRLKAPRTARFAGRFNSAWREPVLANNTWVVTVIVDAQNSFGAEIRSAFRCVIDGDANSYRITEVGW